MRIWDKLPRNHSNAEAKALDGCVRDLKTLIKESRRQSRPPKSRSRSLAVRTMRAASQEIGGALRTLRERPAPADGSVEARTRRVLVNYLGETDGCINYDAEKVKRLLVGLGIDAGLASLERGGLAELARRPGYGALAAGLKNIYVPHAAVRRENPTARDHVTRDAAPSRPSERPQVVLAPVALSARPKPPTDWPFDAHVTSKIMGKLDSVSFRQALHTNTTFADAARDPALSPRQALLTQAIERAQSPAEIVKVLLGASKRGDLVHLETVSLAGRGLQATHIQQICAILEQAANTSQGGLALRHLDLGNHYKRPENKLNHVSLTLIASTPSLGQLESLNLSAGGLDAAALQALVSTPNLKSLKRLDLSSNSIGLAGWLALGKAQHLTSLEQLIAIASTVDPGGVAAICQGKQFKNLQVLDLRSGGAGDEGAESIAAAGHLTSLRTLNLNASEIGERGALALAQAQHLGTLEELNLGLNSMGPDGVSSLANARQFTKLENLHLDKTGAGSDGLKAVAGADHLKSLKTLNMGDNGIGDAGLLAFADAQQFSRLENIMLHGNDIRGTSLQRLLNSKHFPFLKSINLFRNILLPPSASALRAWEASGTERKAIT